MSRARQGALLAAAITSIACIGDTILYSVLPVHAESLGLSDLALGIILSINRFVRILSHSVVAAIMLRIGPKKIMLVASTVASLSTWFYKFPNISTLIIFARLSWGIAYSGFRQSVLYYTAYIDKHRNKVFAQTQFIRPIGPFIILIIGPWLFKTAGYELAFQMIAGVTLLVLALSYFLPDLPVKQEVYHFQNVLKTSKLKLQLALFSFITDGLLVVVLYLLFVGETSTSEALVTMVALFLLLKRGIGFLLPMVLVKSFGHLEIMTHYYGAYLSMNIGLYCLYCQFHQIGLILVFAGGAILETTIPLLAMDQSPSNHMEVVTSITFWWDIGKAVGALLGVVIYKELGGNVVFLGLGIGLVVLFVAEILSKQFGIVSD